MSQFEETVDSDNIECPYCGHTYQPECESYDEDESVDDCGNCGKKFYSRQSFSVDHHARPDCELNGEKHDYQPINLRNGESHNFCTICDKCEPITRK